MNTTRRPGRLTLALRIASVTALTAILALWLATGAHRGWTRTSRVVIQHDEITGIDFPTREKTFVAGVELLAAGIAFSAALAAAGAFTHRRRTVHA